MKDPNDLKPWTLFRRGEGGAIYTAERGDSYYVILDERTLYDLLSEEDREGLTLLRSIEFKSSVERSDFLNQRYR